MQEQLRQVLRQKVLEELLKRNHPLPDDPLWEEAVKSLSWPLDPVVFARKHLLFSPDPWQERVLRSTSKRLLLNCSRQSGKSTTAAIIALHRAIIEPGSLVLLISRSERQSGELFRKVLDFLSIMPSRPATPEENKRSLTFENRSRIVSLPSKEETIRGFSKVDLILLDESARVPDGLYWAVRPMLAVSGGKLILMSTPFGKRGHFFDEWSSGEGWERYKIPATECPRITPEFLAEERKNLPEFWFLQEYMVEFSEAIDQVFSYDDLMRAFGGDEDGDSNIAPLFGGQLVEEESGGWIDEVQPLFGRSL